MRLLYVIPEYPPFSQGGIATFYRHLLPAIAKAGHRVRVLVANAFMDPFAAYEQDSVEVECLELERVQALLPRYSTYAAMPYLQRYLATAWAAWEKVQGEKRSIDLIETTDWGLLFAPWAVDAARPPTLVQCHASIGQIDSYDPQAGMELQGHLIRFIENYGLEALDAVQTYSALNQRCWAQMLRYPPQHIPPALTAPASASAPIADASLRDRGLKSQGPEGQALEGRGLVVGRIQQWKGPLVLCEALHQLGDQAPRIDWVGRDTCYRNSQQSMGDYLRQQYPNVWGQQIRALGAVPPETVAQLQRSADFVVVPSTWDVFNLSAVEAMAQEKVVICSQGAGAAELIDHGRNGLSFPRGDSSALADCLQHCQQMSPAERQAMGQAAGETIRDQLAPAKIAQRRITSYDELITRGTSTAAAHPWLAHAVHPTPPLTQPHAFLDYLPLRSLLTYCGQRLLQKGRIA